MNNLECKIIDIIKAFNDEIPTDVNEDLLHGGYIDSFDIVNIVADFEAVFKIEIKPEDIVPENFNTIRHMVKMMERYCE